MRRAAVLVFFVAALVGTQTASADSARSRHAPVVFVQTNELGGNHIVVYDRGADGRLSQAGTYDTGGNGGAALPGTESDRLAPQGSLGYDPHHPGPLAVNAGSDSVSAVPGPGDRPQLQ